MAEKIRYKIILFTAVFIFAAVKYSAAQSENLNFSPGEKMYADHWILLPSVRLALDPMYILNNDSDISGIFTSAAEIDFLQYSTYILSFSMDQFLNYKDEDSKKYNLHEIQYVLEYLNFRKVFEPGTLGIFIDHRCANYINITSSEDMITRWYGLGLRWETHGMMSGEKGRHKGLRLFSSDNYINYSLALRKSLSTQSYPATWTSDFTLSYDFYIADSVSAYLSGSAEYFVSDEYSWNRSLEGGFRLVSGISEITPYFRYEYITDNIGEIPGGQKRIGAGIRAESALYSNEKYFTQDRGAQPTGNFFPELHFTGSYGYYIGDNKKNFRTSILFALDLIKYNDTALFFNTSLIHSSSKENTGMYPAYIDSYYEGGFSCFLFSRLFVEPFYRYTEYDEGNIIKSGPWNYQLTALRIRTRGMKPGFAGSGIKNNSGNGFNFISNIEIELSGGYVRETDSVDAEWMAESYLRWDIFGYNSSVLYVLFGEKNLNGDDAAWTLISECGIMFNRNLMVMLYYRNEYNDSEDRTRDISRIYHLAGIKFDF